MSGGNPNATYANLQRTVERFTGQLPTGRVFGCHKHDPLGTHPMTEDETCPHCAEDAKILDERCFEVMKAVMRIAGKGAGENQELVDALRALVREVRR